MLHIESGRYYGLRATGAAIWRHLTHPLRIDALCEPLVAEYRVKRERCEADVLPFIRQLVAEGLLVVETGTGQAPGTPVASDVTSSGATLTWAASTDDVGVAAVADDGIGRAEMRVDHSPQSRGIAVRQGELQHVAPVVEQHSGSHRHTLGCQRRA